VLQLPPLQEEHDVPLAPGTDLGMPAMLVLKAENTDIFLVASVSHRGHLQGLFASFSERSFSNFVLHSGHTYS